MKLIGVGEAQAGLSSLVEQSQKERIILTRHGKPVAMLLGIKGRDLEDLVLAQDPAFRNLITDRRGDQRAPVSQETLLAEAKRELSDARSSKARRRSGQKK
jgi:prevent-host-death family protein